LPCSISSSPSFFINHSISGDYIEKINAENSGADTISATSV
jgi:hypothetical protein